MRALLVDVVHSDRSGQPVQSRREKKYTQPLSSRLRERRSEALRRAMGLKISDDGDHKTASERRLSVPQELYHTPHLLDFARHQRDPEWPQLSGYKAPAIF